MQKELLITGGTGSLGKAILKRLSETKHNLKGIRILSRDELKQHNLKKELENNKNLPPIAFIIGDIRDYRRLTEAMRGVNHVIHAAALKQVPTAEENPLEFVKTNVQGTENVLRACIACNVEKAVFVSTDKAAEPTTLYGATKMCGEKLWLKGGIYSGSHGTKFAAVRYGNVIGSRGSITDLISLLDKGQKIPITDPNMTRFWIRLPKVADFILSVLKNMEEGFLYVPKMVSCKLSTFIEATTGTNKNDWKIVGKRPGEKIHEMLINQDELNRVVDIGDRYAICPDRRFWVIPIDECLHSDKRNPLYTEDINVIKEVAGIEQ